jgi:hypothetical protein
MLLPAVFLFRAADKLYRKVGRRGKPPYLRLLRAAGKLDDSPPEQLLFLLAGVRMYEKAYLSSRCTVPAPVPVNLAPSFDDFVFYVEFVHPRTGEALSGEAVAASAGAAAYKFVCGHPLLVGPDCVLAQLTPREVCRLARSVRARAEPDTVQTGPLPVPWGPPEGS